MTMHIIDILYQVYTLMILARILGSWVPDWQNHPIMQFIAYYTDPYLNLFKKIIPPLGMIDISPIVAFFVLGIAKNAIQGVLA
jgi:YggT family protein